MIRFTDKSPIGGIKKTDEGYLVTRARAIRTGVQDYYAGENDDLRMLADKLGKSDTDVIRVYRPPESVFNQDSLKSAIHKPITIDHPSEMVNADNYSEYAVGEVSTEVMRDGEMVAFSLIVKDQKAIDAIESGKAELSAGYEADMIIVDHADYDVIMLPPEYNHLAIVDKARAGHKARIGDNWGAAPLNVTDKEKEMEFVKVMIGDKAVNVAADSADQVTAVIVDHAKEIASKDTAIGELKAKLADAESKILTDAEFDAKVKEMADAQFRKDAVAAKFGNDAIEGATVAEIAGMFKVIDQAPSVDVVKHVLSDKKPGDKIADPWASFKEGKK